MPKSRTDKRQLLRLPLPDPLNDVRVRSDLTRDTLRTTRLLLRRSVETLEKLSPLAPSAVQYWSHELDEVYRQSNALLHRVCDLQFRIETAEGLETASRGLLAGTDDPERWELPE